MDHLPSPQNPYKPVSVKYYHEEQHVVYSGNDWEDFPARVGWDMREVLVHGNLSGRTVKEATSFLQQWLYFGLLESFFAPCGVRVLQYEFVTSDKPHPTLGPEKVLDFLRSPEIVRLLRLETSEGTGESVQDAQDEMMWITTEKLPVKLVEWQEKFEKLARKERIEYLEKCAKFFTGMNVVLDRIASRITQYREQQLEAMMQVLALRTILPTDLEISVKILHDTLESQVKTHPDYPSTTTPIQMDEIFVRRLAATGRCPGMLRRNKFGSLSLLYYASLLGPPKALKDHKNCRFADCTADHINNDTYQTKHAQGVLTNHPDASESAEPCTCPLRGGSMEKLCQIINNGQIPLISLPIAQEELSNAFYSGLDIVPFQSEMQYIAITHVWADGLGNASSNRIHVCQIIRLWTWLRDIWIQNVRQTDDGKLEFKGDTDETEPRFFKADGRMYFWLDTLCVPLDPVECRRKAITNMRETYKSAAGVLVLDSELLEHEVDSDALLDILVKVALSGWQSRLWTLQEAIVARRVWLQFEDNALSLTHLFMFARQVIRDMDTESSRFLYETVLKELMMILSLEKGSNESTRLPHALGLLRNRRTSKQSDEAICVAAMFNYDLSHIVSISDDRKWPTLIRHMVEDINPAFVFDSGPKLQEPGYRWAPSTFLCARTTYQCFDLRPRNDRASGYLADNFLVEKHPGVLFQTTAKSIWSTFTFQEHKSRNLWLVVLDMPSNLSVSESGAAWEKLCPDPGANLALMVESALHGNGGKQGDVGSRAALVEILDEQKAALGRFECAYIAPARVLELKNDTSDDGNEYSMAEIRKILEKDHVEIADNLEDWWTDSTCHLVGQWCSKDQKWHIS